MESPVFRADFQADRGIPDRRNIHMQFPKKFYAASDKYATFEEPVPAYCYRKTFFCENTETASLLLCGLGLYELFINGNRITRGRLSSYLSNPDHILYYDEYDVSEHIIKGKNTIAVVLGNGILNCPGGSVWNFDIAPYRSAPKFALAFTMGDIQFDASSFITAPTPIIFNDLRAGEWYDARLYDGEQTATAYDDSHWQPVIPAETPRGKAKCNASIPMRVSAQLKAQTVRKSRISIFPQLSSQIPDLAMPDDERTTEGYIYDFGVNTTGVCRLHIRNSRPGQKIILQYGEILGDNDAGEIDTTVRNADSGLDLRGFHFLPHRYNNRDVYICKGDADEIWEPYFTHHGFRYCLVIGIDEQQVCDDTVTATVFHTALEQITSFTCSNDIINRLWDAGIRSDIGNFCHFPTDCPHREKNGWTGDANISAEQMLTVLNCENNLKEWLCNIRCAMQETGELPGIVPTSDWGYDTGPAWDGVIIEIPFQIWRLRGDTDVIRENAAAIFRHLHFISGRRTKEGLIAYGLGDWCPAGRLYSDVSKASTTFTSTVTAMQLCEKAAKMYAAIGMHLEKAYAESLWNEYRTALRQEMVDLHTMTTYDRCQTSQAMAIYYNVFEKAEQTAAFHALLEMIEKNNRSFDCGILGMRVIFHVLSRFGQTELALHMITKPDFPSYRYWIDHDATTFWELFAPITTEQSSCNHHFFGDILSWFVQNLAGIRIDPDYNGTKNVRIEPHFPASLSFAEAEMKIADTEDAIVCSKWHREGDTIILNTAIPAGVKAALLLDSSWQSETGYTNIHLEGEQEFRLIRSEQQTVFTYPV